MGRYIGAYGYGVETPAMDAFAEQSTLFRHAYCCGPTCSPSRVGLLTGRTPHQEGMLGLAHRGFHLEYPEHHLGAHLSKHGFSTALFGIQHEFNGRLGDMPYGRIETGGHLDTPLERDKWATARACDFLKEDHDQPFFMSFGLFYPHRPFLRASEYKGRIRPPEVLPDVAPIREDMEDYACSVGFADECLGTVLDEIKAHGYFDNSIIILTTDHGMAFPNMKCSLTDHGIGVALLLHYPGNPTSGKQLDSLVSHIDIFPTICDLICLEFPEHLQGHSFVPLLKGENSKARNEVFSEVTYHAAYEPKRCIRTHRYKLILRWAPLTYPLANCDSSPSKSFLRQHDWPQNPLPEAELYDLVLDPQEQSNLAGDQFIEVVERDLRQRLMDWMRQTDDPLLSGHVERPAGALVNRNDSEEPGNTDYEEIKAP
ncbi:sulfatase [Cerasicoccus arenae]|nr:sulfatase [Cerasicoccus arenae]